MLIVVYYWNSSAHPICICNNFFQSRITIKSSIESYPWIYSTCVSQLITSSIYKFNGIENLYSSCQLISTNRQRYSTRERTAVTPSTKAFQQWCLIKSLIKACFHNKYSWRRCLQLNVFIEKTYFSAMIFIDA